MFYDKSDENIDKFNKSKGLSYNQSVIKHGLSAANKMMKSRLFKVGKASKQSLVIFIPFYKYLRKSGIARSDIYFGVNGSSEYLIKSLNNFYLFDFTIKSKTCYNRI